MLNLIFKRLSLQFLVLSLITISFSSCVRKEPLNSECDIISASIDEKYLIEAPIIENNRIIFSVKPGSDLSAFAPTFEITDGATIIPSSGTVRDFSTPQTYIVTSQDKEWKKTYQVIFITHESKDRYSFENFEQYSQTMPLFHIFYENEDGKKNYIWASGNQGFAITNGGNPPETYPTYSTTDGYSGRGVTMTTRSTGSLGSMMGMPIAAGNLFIGSFNVSVASSPSTALKATQFGKPYSKRPVFIKGWYKYAPGKIFTDNKNTVIAGKLDEFDIYAVFYEPTPERPHLNGENILTDKSIIAIARVQDRSAKADFTLFKAQFVYKPGKTIDPEKLKNYKYNMAIICSSSIDGGKFFGAVGSTLIVDEIEIITE